MLRCKEINFRNTEFITSDISEGHIVVITFKRLFNPLNQGRYLQITSKNMFYVDHKDDACLFKLFKQTVSSDLLNKTTKKANFR